MKRISMIFLQAIIILIAIGALALMLWEPHLEGRNVHATLFEIYFKDPFLAYAYTASIAFFVGLYKVFKLLGYIGRNQEFSQASLHALRAIKYCGVVLVALIAAPVTYLFIARPGDDIAGGVAIGLLLALLSGATATAAAVVERRLTPHAKS